MEQSKIKKVGNIASHGLKRIITDQRLVLLVVIVVLAIVIGSINPRFLTLNNIIIILQQVSVLGLITLGMAILMLSGGLDLSVGNIMILSGITIAVMIDRNPDNPAIVPIAVGAGLLIGIAAGALNGFIIAKSRCMPLIISLGMSGVYFGMALLISDGRYLSYRRAFEPLRAFRLGGIVPLNTIIFLVMAVIFVLLLMYSKYGRRIVAIGGNEQNARLSGINVDKYKIITYAISGLLCAIASVLLASRLDSIVAAGGAGMELNALTACIIGGITFDGGRGSIFGAFLGVIFMGIIANGMNVLGIESSVQVVVSGVIIVAAVIISNANSLRRK